MEDRNSAENKTLEFWEQNNIFEKSVNQNPKGKQYVFYDGPPFATGLPHYGHILGLTSKDLFPRYWTMKGYRVEKRWGWDCHGLPIENIVENELGIKQKKKIEEMGIDTFNELCRSKVLFFAHEWKKTVRRMGWWGEFDDSYKTMDNSYMETVWWIFKKLWEMGYVYEGKRVLLFCPRCQTPLAKAEIAMDESYKDVTEKTAIVKFKLKSENNTYILAWTTTAWTLIGNVALAVNSKIDYVKVKRGDEFLILAKDRLEVVKGAQILEQFKGKDLLGKEYDPLYKIHSDKKCHHVIDGGAEVNTIEGTGIVHIAIYGEFDYEMIKKYDLPMIQHIGKDGALELGPDEWVGLWFKKVDYKVLENLKKRGLLFEVKTYTHSYPFCYRCDTPLIYNALDSWFVDIQKVKQRLLEKNQDVNWYPENIKNGMFKNNLESAPDWNISRNRFWATSIPVWKCQDCSNLTIIGSVKELQEKSIEKVPHDIDLHKHTVDKIHIRCDKCKGVMKRVPEVMDCWFESGSMPYASKHYPFKNVNDFGHNFPADFVSEYISQVRTWFYYMHVLGVLLFDKPPFKNVVVSGTVLAENGSKMSKSKRNFPDPNLMFEKYGADALRFYLMSSTLMRAHDLNFSERGLEETSKKIIILLDNVKKFYELFSEESVNLKFSPSDNILDRWILSRLNLLVRNVTNSLDDYNTIVACKDIADFIDNLSTWYVRRSRDRFKSEDTKLKSEALNTLSYVLFTLSKLMAPITPFISEDIHKMFRRRHKGLPESVHLEKWPNYDNDLIDEKLHEKMGEIRNIVSLSLEARDRAKIPVRQILNTIEVSGVNPEKEYLDLVKAEVNVKNVKLVGGDALAVKLDKKITQDLLQEGLSREIIRNMNKYRKELNLTIKNRIVLYYETKDKALEDSFKNFNKEIMLAIQADKIEGKIPKGVNVKEIIINKAVLKIGFKILN